MLAHFRKLLLSSCPAVSNLSTYIGTHQCMKKVPKNFLCHKLGPVYIGLDIYHTTHSMIAYNSQH